MSDAIWLSFETGCSARLLTKSVWDVKRIFLYGFWESERARLAANLNHCQYPGVDMTVHKRWDIERSRNRFSPHYLEHEKWKMGDYGAHPIDKYLRPGRIPHIWCSGCGLGITMTCFISALEETGLQLE
ncbi:MAG: hypothetical protein V3U20_04525, partial [Thermoplasmata archaeon]